MTDTSLPHLPAAPVASSLDEPAGSAAPGSSGSGSRPGSVASRLDRLRTIQPPAFGRFGSVGALGLAGAGLLAIGVAWNGTASQTSLLAQVPYLVSGGILGLGLVVLAAALMVVNGGREDRARLEAKLDALVEALVASGLGQPAPSDLSGLVVAGTASYHSPTCRLVEGRDDLRRLTPEEASVRGLAPCRVCHPDAIRIEVPPAPEPRRPRSRRPR